ncbi:MAG: hypothetical protein WB952_17120 [Terriglobales bacterium]
MRVSVKLVYRRLCYGGELQLPRMAQENPAVNVFVSPHRRQRHATGVVLGAISGL